MRGPPHRKNRGGRLYSTSAKRRCIVYVVMFCASRDHESWQGVASLRDATRKGVEQLTRKSFSIRFSRALPILLILCDSCECPSRSDGPPVGWPCSERIACRGASLRDAGANTYAPIYAQCADAWKLPYPCINRPVHPLNTGLLAWNIPSFRMSYQVMLLKTRADSRDWRFLEVK